MQAHCGEIFVKVLSLIKRFLFVVGAAIYMHGSNNKQDHIFRIVAKDVFG